MWSFHKQLFQALRSLQRLLVTLYLSVTSTQKHHNMEIRLNFPEYFIIHTKVYDDKVDYIVNCIWNMYSIWVFLYWPIYNFCLPMSYFISHYFAFIFICAYICVLVEYLVWVHIRYLILTTQRKSCLFSAVTKKSHLIHSKQ